jgi:hypothetical protein
VTKWPNLANSQKRLKAICETKYLILNIFFKTTPFGKIPALQNINSNTIDLVD